MRLLLLFVTLLFIIGCTIHEQQTIKQPPQEKSIDIQNQAPAEKPQKENNVVLTKESDVFTQLDKVLSE